MNEATATTKKLYQKKVSYACATIESVLMVTLHKIKYKKVS
jgi:hypothetical protein